MIFTPQSNFPTKPTLKILTNFDLPKERPIVADNVSGQQATNSLAVVIPKQTSRNIAYFFVSPVAAKKFLFAPTMDRSLNWTGHSNGNQNLWEIIMTHSTRSDKDLDEIMATVAIGQNFRAQWGKKTVYKIEGYDVNSSGLDSFPLKTYRNYLNYFTSRYKAVINHPFQFMVYAYDKSQNASDDQPPKRVMLFPELLIPAEKEPTAVLVKEVSYSDQMEKFYTTKKLVKAMKKHSFHFDVSKTESEDTNTKIEFEFSESLRGIRFNPPKLKTAADGFIYPNPNNGSFNTTYQIFEGPQLINWAIVYDRTFEDSSVTASKNLYYQVIQDLRKMGTHHKIRVDFPCVTYCMKKKMTAQELHEKLRKTGRGKDLSLILFLVHRKLGDEIYIPFKAHFNGEGIATQVWSSYHQKNSFSVITKILSQMLAKTGGSVWKVENPLAPEELGSNSLIVGLGIKSVNSGCLISLNCNIDKHMSLFYSNIKYVKHSEMGDLDAKIAECITEAVFKFDRSRSFPTNLIVFQDTSFGILNVKKFDSKITAIKTDIEEKIGIGLKVAFIIVDRVFDEELIETVCHNYSRPINGLVIRNDFVNKDHFDFYLGIERGTNDEPKITHFNVVFNETDFESELIKLAYYQSFYYFNHEGVVEIPAVLKNAKRQANFCKKTKAFPDSNLREKLYFL